MLPSFTFQESVRRSKESILIMIYFCLQLHMGSASELPCFEFPISWNVAFLYSNILFSIPYIKKFRGKEWKAKTSRKTIISLSVRIKSHFFGNFPCSASPAKEEYETIHRNMFVGQTPVKYVSTWGMGIPIEKTWRPAFTTRFLKNLCNEFL